MSVFTFSSYKLRCVLSGFVLFVASYLSAQTDDSTEKEISINTSLERAFLPNLGQLQNDQGEILEEVYFYFEEGHVKVYITDWGISYFFLRPVSSNEESLYGSAVPGLYEWQRIDMILENANIDKENISVLYPTKSFSNYYGQKEHRYFEKTYGFGELIVHEIYPGIDWSLHFDKANDGGFKQDFIVKPGGDFAKINMEYVGAESMYTKLEEGHLQAECEFGGIDDGRVLAYTSSEEVKMNYVEVGKNEYTFGLMSLEYDRSDTLIIDPYTLTWCTYYGGALSETGNMIWSDTFFTWVTGEVLSADLPCLNPAGGAYYQGVEAGVQDAFLLKFDVNGVPILATYYGGTGIEMGTAIHSDGTNVWVTGNTTSTNFPVQNPGGGVYYQSALSGTSDMFIIKFNSSGVRQWATYYGGNGDDSGSTIFSNGTSVFVGGYSESSNFPLHNAGGGAYYQATFGGVRDAVVLKFSVAGVRQWATYYGGIDTEEIHSLHVNGTILLIGGETSSDDLPIQNPGGGAYYQTAPDGLEMFILKCTTAGVRQWCTYYGGNDDEVINSVYTDGTSLWAAGYAVSLNFPVMAMSGAYFDGSVGTSDSKGVIMKFSATGVRQWVTCYGGDVNTHCRGIFSDGTTLWVVGATESSDFPTQAPSTGGFYQPHNSNLPNIISESWDLFILEFSTAGVRSWSTYLGDVEDDFGNYAMYDGTFLWCVGTVTSDSGVPLISPGAGAYYQTTCDGCATMSDALIMRFGLPLVLPVSLVEFEVEGTQDNIVRTHWMTESEINNMGFDLERSADGLSFYKLAYLEGFGTCNATHNYHFEDIHPFHGWNYYRLKQIDLNGAYTYSNIVGTFISIPGMEVYPNPSHGIFAVQMADPIHFRIFDASGRDVGFKITSSNFSQSFLIELISPKPGIYFATDNNGNSTKLIIE